MDSEQRLAILKHIEEVEEFIKKEDGRSRQLSDYTIGYLRASEDNVQRLREILKIPKKED